MPPGFESAREVQGRRPVRMDSITLILTACLAACGSSGTTGPVIIPPEFDLAVQEVAAGLADPLYVTAPVGDPRLFVVEQSGRIRIIKNGQLLQVSFLDIVARVSSGGERGLLSVAFHPAYATNGFFYVNFTDVGGNTRVERFSVSSNPDVADPGSSKLILTVAQPFSNHNGGLNLFGSDGMLYIGLGDGGSGGDPQGNGQNRGALLGKILRIDVDRGDPYAIPADNPFVGQQGARGEVWAFGLRNPWRFAFDRTAGLLYVADVGQNRFEEVDVVVSNRAGVNYGWNTMEAASCFGSSSCNQQGLELPVLVYDHSGGACSITGGFVYRGTILPEIGGHYFYSDYCAGFLRSFRYRNGAAVDQRTWDVGSIGSITSFGVDAAGELYLTSSNGRVYRIVRRS
ncbi:MAG TPA: PQQ-dependent sugar dehydrogenase [Rhodothermia bacterium]|nr:PQQ-dependent sugar dehydrogenase [Rhodothermia bacterium]